MLILFAKNALASLNMVVFIISLLFYILSVVAEHHRIEKELAMVSQVNTELNSYMETFDLTTKDGMEIAKKYFELTPVGMLFKIGKMIFDSDSVKKQGKTVEDLIKAGKEKGVDEMDILLDRMDGLKIDVPGDIRLSTEFGSHDKMTIHVKYK